MLQVVIIVRKLILKNMKSKKLLKFSAEWCGPCKMLSPIIQEMKGQDLDFEIIEYDTQQSPDMAQKYGIRSIPTMIALVDDVEVGRLVGVKGEQEIKELFT